MTTHAVVALGTLARIWRYPVKSLRGESLRAVRVGADGLEGDRRRALFLSTPDHARTGKPYRGKEHNLLHLQTEAAAAATLIAQRGLSAEERTDGPFFDDHPVSVLLDCWLRELEALVGEPLDPLRFRPNLYVETTRPWPSEAAFFGAIIRAGAVSLRVVSPIERCVTTTYDQTTGESNPAVLRALAQDRDNVMGVYCSVEEPGEIAAGDAVTVLAGPRAPSPA